MFTTRIRPTALTIATALTIGASLATGVAAQAAKPAKSTAVIGLFRGSIRTGPLADLSLDGSIGLTVDGATGDVQGVLVDGDGAGRTYVLAHVTGHVGAHGATLVFHTASGRVISGTATQALKPYAILRGTLRTTGGTGDWLVLPPGSITAPTQILCIAGKKCKTPPLGGGDGGPGPGQPGGGEPSGGNDDTFCNELESNLDLNDPVVMKLLENMGCAV